MKMLLKVVPFFVVVAMGSAATFLARHPEKPIELAHKQGCYIKEINDVIPFGEEITPLGACVRIDCGRRYIDYATCGVVFTNDPGCYVTKGTLNRPYPDCCPDVKCDNDNLIGSLII